MLVKYNYLIDFDVEECSESRCEDVVEGIAESFRIYHGGVTRLYDRENKTYDMFVYMYASDEDIDDIKGYLDVHGFEGKYSINLVTVI